MASLLRSLRRKAILRGNPIADQLWQQGIAELPVLRHIEHGDFARLREYAALFLAEKSLLGAHDLVLDDALKLSIAIQACVPILHLGFSVYDDWQTIIVYPSEFIATHEYTDESGVVHATRDILAGEAWLRGPLVISAAEVRSSGEEDGVNVVIHECAHKLDMLNGDANGFPPLHRGMDRARWSTVFQSAYDDFCNRLDANEATAIDPYAAENPAEFFAVFSEAFFEIPQQLLHAYPAVYEQLKDYYRQDPAKAFGPLS